MSVLVHLKYKKSSRRACNLFLRNDTIMKNKIALLYIINDNYSQELAFSMLFADISTYHSNATFTVSPSCYMAFDTLHFCLILQNTLVSNFDFD